MFFIIFLIVFLVLLWMKCLKLSPLKKKQTIHLLHGYNTIFNNFISFLLFILLYFIICFLFDLFFSEKSGSWKLWFDVLLNSYMPRKLRWGHWSLELPSIIVFFYGKHVTKRKGVYERKMYSIVLCSLTILE